MNQKNIEQLANRILQAEKFSKPPIIAEQLAEFYFDLEIEWTSLQNDNVAAALSVSEKKIYVNELITNVGLKNFTIAHEIGHWVLHKDLIGQHSPQMEREADKFATYLLMPEKIVREEFSKFNEHRFLKYFPTDMKVSSLADTFCVSYTAMKIRLSQWELKLIYVDFNSGKCYRSKKEFLEKEAGQIKLF